VDEWVASLEWEDFEAVLPLLRRTFADFSVYDRQRLLTLAKEGPAQIKEDKTPDKTKSTEVAKVPSGDDALLGSLLEWVV
jgi:hypothetical protein